MTAKPEEIPQKWEEVTAEWMTAAVAARHPGAHVSEVVLTASDDGTNRRARFALRYDAGSGPAAVFCKAEGQHRRVHAGNGNLFNEPDLFASGVELPVDHPLSYRVVIDREGLDYVIVMEDVTKRGADPRDATRPLTIDQVANGLRGLARLHGRYWEVEIPELAWVQRWAPTEGYLAPLRERIPAGLKLAEGHIADGAERYDTDDLLGFLARSLASFGQAPTTLLHGDPHIGNTYVLPDDEVGFLDWQVLRTGHWSHDVGYFLVSSLPVEDRRDHELDLLEEYRAALEQPTTPEESWLRYRASTAYGLGVWLATLGAGSGAQTEEVCLALTERYSAAFVDLDTPEALGRLGLL